MGAGPGVAATWGGGVVLSGLVVWITPKWVVASTTCMGSPFGPRVGAMADPSAMATDFVGWTLRLLWDRYEMVTSSKSLACSVTVGPWSGVWGLCGVCATVRLVLSTKPTQGEEEGVGRLGRVVTLDGDGQGECHEKVQEGPFCSSLAHPAAWAEARSGADCVLGAQVVEGEAQAFPDRFQKEPGGVREGSADVEEGDDVVQWVHIGDGVLEEDGLVWGPARDSSPEAGGYVGVWVGADAAQEGWVPTILTSVTAHTMGRQLFGFAQSYFV